MGSTADVECVDSVNNRISEARADLIRAAEQLHPESSLEQQIVMATRAINEMRRVQQNLALVQHLEYLEGSGFEDALAEIDRRLTEGWVPEGRPAADAVADLRAGFVR